jgi:ElaB/YqjD/DUF883 family membrane-anchored ribosome-binding protein
MGERAMNEESNWNQLSTEEIRQQIAQTRSSLVQKIDSLDKQVKAAIDGGAESFKETVEQVVQSVKQAFDLRRQLEEHPWAMLGGSLVVGYLAGRVVLHGRGISSTTGRAATADGHAASNLEPPPAAMELPAADRPSSETCSYRTESKNTAPTFLEELTQQLAPELKELKALAIRFAAELLREVIEQTLESARSSHVPRATESAPPDADSAPTAG